MNRLITIPMSHYCEKARWGLAHAGVTYVEDAHLQVFHYRVVRAFDSHGMVPVLVTDDGAIADSSAILRYLDRQLETSRKLYPESDRAQIERLEEQFDEHLGVETRRWVYFHWLGQSGRRVLETAAQGVPRWEQVMAPLLLPILRRYLGKRLEISAGSVAQGSKTIMESFDSVAAIIGDGRPFLRGDRFTAADLTFASMAAPVLLPAEYGIRLPTPEQAPDSARADIQRFRSHPAGRFALRLFRDHRRGLR
ncbi:glutathione S-transferase family protein [Solimonas terrae]|uniref:Glutathione S-transferase family protein n=1 Tax=Solimonas terrae TaxID=1396819 RepID=A0A6M2BWQ3_9GAMM|nr:glutathione S-transferase family protein [Solimonas terrae]NGY06621.1 glutathione S-transferase family protein [Solimonas terrae]